MSVVVPVVVEQQPHGDLEMGGGVVTTPLIAAAEIDIVAANLMEMRGVVVRQETQFLESFAQGLGLPYEARNRYKICRLPEGRKVAVSPEDPERWTPTNKDLLDLPAALLAHEESTCGWRAASGTSCMCSSSTAWSYRPSSVQYGLTATSSGPQCV